MMVELPCLRVSLTILIVLCRCLQMVKHQFMNIYLKKNKLTLWLGPVQWLWAPPGSQRPECAGRCRWAWWPRFGRYQYLSSRGCVPPSPPQCRPGGWSPWRPASEPRYHRCGLGGWPSPRRPSSRRGLPPGHSRWQWHAECRLPAARCQWNRAGPEKSAAGQSGGPVTEPPLLLGLGNGH